MSRAELLSKYTLIKAHINNRSDSDIPSRSTVIPPANTSSTNNPKSYSSNKNKGKQAAGDLESDDSGNDVEYAAGDNRFNNKPPISKPRRSVQPGTEYPAYHPYYTPNTNPTRQKTQREMEDDEEDALYNRRSRSIPSTNNSKLNSNPNINMSAEGKKDREKIRDFSKNIEKLYNRANVNSTSASSGSNSSRRKAQTHANGSNTPREPLHTPRANASPAPSVNANNSKPPAAASFRKACLAEDIPLMNITDLRLLMLSK